MIHDIGDRDLYLLDILAGRKTTASIEVIDFHHEAGHTTTKAGVRTLTPKGQARAKKLKHLEATLRSMSNNIAAGGPAITTIGATAINF